MRAQALAAAIVLAGSASAVALPPIRSDQRLAPPMIGVPDYSRNIELTGSIASDGRRLVAVWRDWDGGNLFAAHFDPSGKSVDSASTPVADGVWGEPKILFTGHDYLVIYNAGHKDNFEVSHYWSVRVRRMSLDLTMLDEQPHLIAQNMTFAGAAVNGK